MESRTSPGRAIGSGTSSRRRILGGPARRRRTARMVASRTSGARGARNLLRAGPSGLLASQSGDQRLDARADLVADPPDLFGRLPGRILQRPVLDLAAGILAYGGIVASPGGHTNRPVADRPVLPPSGAAAGVRSDPPPPC